MSSTVVTLDHATDDRVQKLAVAQQRSPEGLIREAIERYISHEEGRQSALAAWDAYEATGLHATADEADAWLAKLERGEDAEPPACHI